MILVPYHQDSMFLFLLRFELSLLILNCHNALPHCNDVQVLSAQGTKSLCLRSKHALIKCNKHISRKSIMKAWIRQMKTCQFQIYRIQKDRFARFGIVLSQQKALERKNLASVVHRICPQPVLKFATNQLRTTSIIDYQDS